MPDTPYASSAIRFSDEKQSDEEHLGFKSTRQNNQERRDLTPRIIGDAREGNNITALIVIT